MRVFLVVCLAILFSGAIAQADSTLSVAFGVGVPKDPTGKTFVLKSGPSRANGGEHFVVRFSTAKMITDIKLSSFSLSRAGKNLIRNVVAYNGTSSEVLDNLFQFAKVTMGKPENYQNLAMIPDRGFVESIPNQSFTRLDFTVEGFANNDTSLLLQISSAGEISTQEFLVTRTGPNDDQTAGSYVNEAAYKSFNGEQLRTLMNVAATPSAAELSGKSFSCSSYSKLDAAALDIKARTYFTDSSGNLFSNSAAQGPSAAWGSSEDGLRMVIENRNGCGSYQTYNVIRRTGEGNLISEVVLDLDHYIDLCTNAGYDTSATRELELYSTFPSSINAKYVVGTYEFCRPAN